MSLSTTCSLFWVDTNDNVVEVDHDSAVCDSTYTSCTITGSHGGTLSATCDSKQRYSDATGASSHYASYFCACNGNSATIPSGVTCSPACYDLTTQFPTCNVVWVYNGFTSGSASNIVKQDICPAFTCDSNGVECTDSSSTLLYQCDNQEHQSQVESDSNNSYICNCHGAAQIPELYRGSSGASTGSACGNSNGGGGSGTTTTQPSNGGAASVTTSPIVASPQTTTTQPSVQSPTTPAPSPSNSPSSGSASSSLTVSKGVLLSLCSSVLLKLIFH